MEPPPPVPHAAQESFTNPQEPPPPSRELTRDASLSSVASSSGKNKKKRLPACIFDLYFDLPHPAASTTDKARVVEPPVTVSPLLHDEFCGPEKVARLAQFAFPEHDDASAAADRELADARARDGKLLTSLGRAVGAHLTKHDVYHVDFAVHHHTFSLLLSDGRTRVHGHVRRYLPAHADAGVRMDVGRRRPRAMVLLTRALGGERFYTSVLKTVESIVIESKVNKQGCYSKKKDPVRSFLHSLFNAHATLITQYAELRRHGLSLNFTQPPPSSLRLSGSYATAPSACDTAKAVMEDNEDLFRITLDKLEFGAVGCVGGDAAGVGGGGKDKRRVNVSNIRIEKDVVSFYLPPTLQPGFECLPVEIVPEDLASPIIPLLRYIGSTHFVRLVSALLCERRIILISKSVTRLSMCVRAAAAVLAQGLLLWRHVLIPVVPPHMIQHLGVRAPYLVGMLHPYASRLGKVEGLTDVLCVNLDKNEVKTLNMSNPRATVPDMLKKAGKRSSSDAVGAPECLARDLDEIAKADLALWHQEGARANGGGGAAAGGGTREGGVKGGLDSSENLRADGAAATKRESLLEKMKNPMKRSITITKQRVMSMEEKRQYETSVDAAVAFGKMIRKSFAVKDGDEDGDDANDEDESDIQANAAPKYVAPSHDIHIGSSGVEPSIVAENEGGEEDVRAALTCFFIHMYGDMGMYLSETQGTFWLDRRKFLLRKKQLGEKENAPTFIVLQKFSASSMFATHVKSRIEDMSMTARDRSSIMPHHIPLFDVCSKYLSVHRLDFSLINIRRIVAKTVLACVRHLAVEYHVAIRAKALALTDDTPYEGNVSVAITELVDSCHECNTNLSVVMSVIWRRLNQTDETKKTNMHILLALHLLKNLVSNGPLTAITEALDGAGKIYELKSYSDAKSVDHNYEVRQAADHVYSLLVDLSTLFCRRRRLAYSKAQKQIVIPNNHRMWSDYLVRRLPLTIDPEKLHALFRPEGISGRVFYGEGGSVGPSVARSTPSVAPSIRALNRLGKSLRNSRQEAMYNGDEDSRLSADDDDDTFFNDDGTTPGQYLKDGREHWEKSNVERSAVSRNGQDLDLSSITRDVHLDQSSLADSRYDTPAGRMPDGGMTNSTPQALGNIQEEQLGAFSQDDAEHHGVSAEDNDIEEQRDQFSFPAHTFTPEIGRSVLDNFNYAVSSSGASSQAGGSQYGSEWTDHESR